VVRLSGGRGGAWFVAGFVARVARLARTPTMGSSVVARLSGGAGVACWMVAGFGARVARSARTPTMGSSVVARLSGGAGVAWMAAGFGARVAMLAKTPTGAKVARSARTPCIISNVVAGLSGRAGMAWRIVAGFGSWVSGVAGCCKGNGSSKIRQGGKKGSGCRNGRVNLG
jgi:hypothetical protein